MQSVVICIGDPLLPLFAAMLLTHRTKNTPIEFEGPVCYHARELNHDDEP